MSNITIYTANIGDYDNIRNDILCFQQYNRFIHPRLNAKIYKILFYQFVITEWSIWIDSNLFLKVSPSYLIDLADNHEICLFKHPERDCIYDEAEVCKQRNLDYPDIIDNQINKYRNINYPEHNGLAYCNLIIRKNTKNIRKLCDSWWSEICCGSWRDQISFPVISQNADIKYLDTNLINTIYIKKSHIKNRECE